MKFKSFFRTFLPPVLLMLPLFLSARIPVIPLEFEDAKTSDSFRSLHLAERFRSMAAAVTLKKKNALTVRLELLPADAPGHFLLNTETKGKNKVLTICVPLQFGAWKSDYNVHTWLMSVLLLAGMGEMPTTESIGKIRGHWIVRGLARKAAYEKLFSDTPLGRTMPGAYTLISNGVCPSLPRIVNPPPAGLPTGSIVELDAEFAELLLEAVSDAGLFRSGAGDTLLHLALLQPDADQYAALEKLMSANPKLLRGQSCDVWFRNFAERRLINFMTPFSAEFFEKKYRDITVFRFQDAKGKECECRPGNIISHWENLTEAKANKVLDLWIADLNLLAFRVPLFFRGELAEIRLALSRLRTEQTEEAQEHVRQTEQKLFQKLSDYIATGQLLREAEQKMESPAIRLRRTLDSADGFRNHTRLLLPEIQKNLDRWDDYK